MESRIRYRVEAAVAEIGLPSAAHAVLDHSLAKGLLAALEQAANDEQVRAVLIGGSGFCAGLPNPDLATLDWVTAPIRFLAEMTKPVMVAIGGPALAEGLELALACDIRIASPRACFSMPQILEGRLPAAGGTQRLPRLIAKGLALDLLLTGRTLKAPEALAAGLITELVQTDLRQIARERIRAIAANAPIATRYAKEAVLSGLDMPLPQGLRLEADLNFLLQTTADRAEGLRAFVQKRRPDFMGV